ncbi:6-phosphogluconolactonase [Haematomicrobium sanguinis]|uniref:6-phosphogluconolactonase n=1 Tax=Haematomicrobium sanguinis TaxID=479106 RepID=UPI00047A7DA1|nr:6-phosphogluconolactonase [Haematomicrobium sanguinis]
MSSKTYINLHPGFDVLAATTAARLITRLVDVQNVRGEATVVLTGGTLGQAVLEAVAASKARDAVNWRRVNFWWGDERFVPKDSPERNARQAWDALLSHIDVDPSRVHEFGASDEFDSLEAAAQAYADELARAAASERRYTEETNVERMPEVAAVSSAAQPNIDERLPIFDVLLLGMGPDAHVASLFPELAGIREKDKTVIYEYDAPKPPPERLSLTLPAINTAHQIWICVAGTDKAGAVGLALAGAGPVQVPAAGVKAVDRTFWLIDQDAAAKVPRNLIYTQDN